MIEGFIDGFLLVTEQGAIVRANSCAQQICHRLQAAADSTPDLEPAPYGLPAPIWRVCQAVIESRELFPGLKIVPDHEVTLADGAIVRIRAQWLELNLDRLSPEPPPYILVTLEDRNQSIQNLALADRQKCGLTDREGQIWQLRLRGYSYREIAGLLYITPNTVKKHMKNILAKRRAIDEGEMEG